MGSFGFVSGIVAITIVCSTLYNYVKNRRTSKSFSIMLPYKRFSKICQKYRSRMNHLLQSENYMNHFASDDFFFYDEEEDRIYEMVERSVLKKSTSIVKPVTIFYIESKTRIRNDIFSLLLDLYTNHGYKEIYVVDPLHLHHLTYDEYSTFFENLMMENATFESSLLNVCRIVTILPYIQYVLEKYDSHHLMLV